jgi:lysine-specific demethylase 8
MHNNNGPTFQRVEEISFDEFSFGAHVAKRTTPLLVKGAVKHWPAWTHWSFENIAAQCEARKLTARFQTALTEQGITQPARFLPVASYLHSLHRAAQIGLDPNKGLVNASRRAQLDFNTRFTLDWTRMNNQPDRLYLQQWDLLKNLPHLRQDFPMNRLWPGLRKTWEYAFIGPADTLSGLHFDFPNNWFCQVRGSKEFILFTQDQTAHLSVSKKYDWGATLSDVNIARLQENNDINQRFSKASGLYAHVEAGDALYIPKRTWHAVVALTPSISIGIFGLTPIEILTGGVSATVKDSLHRAHLYRWGRCTCHAGVMPLL